jgi:hypothetical protein
VDTYFAFNPNDPATGSNFLAGTGTNAGRANRFDLNLAMLEVAVAPEPVGLRLALGFGTAAEVVHGFEPGGAAAVDIWRHVITAAASYKVPVGSGLLLEAGIFPSHIGFESLPSHANWNYTRSWVNELAPYYQTGLKASYAFTERWSAQLHLLNGWHIIGDNNRGKSVGAQVAYTADAFTVALNGLVGPELTDNDTATRVFGEVVATVKPVGWLSLAAVVDYATEPDIGTGGTVGTASWYGGAAYARAELMPQLAVALRGEAFMDPNGRISGASQTLRELTATVEVRPIPELILKLEGRYDQSSNAGFSRTTSTGPVLVNDQLLVLLGVVAAL